MQCLRTASCTTETIHVEHLVTSTIHGDHAQSSSATHQQLIHHMINCLLSTEHLSRQCSLDKRRFRDSSHTLLPRPYIVEDCIWHILTTHYLATYELLDVLPTHDKDVTYYTMHGTCSPCHRARICDSFATVCQYTVYYRSVFPHLLSLLHETQLNGSIVYHVRISQVGSLILVSPCPACTTYNVTVR